MQVALGSRQAHRRRRGGDDPLGSYDTHGARAATMRLNLRSEGTEVLIGLAGADREAQASAGRAEQTGELTLAPDTRHASVLVL